ncbi:MAG: DNA cytosine methyltransferase [Bradyrhizobium sp.]|nr:DNA cytosine methyltransferase [Bradyrhizobium sp.]
MNEALRTMHLFAGAGGGLLADLILGHRPVVAVEWDAYACQVLRERAADGWFPGLHVYEGDVRLFDPSEYAGSVDCIAAGFPCQDISVAGKGAGIGEGTRSGLYREVLRIAGIVRPRYLWLENVAAIVPLLGTVVGDLAALGYDCRWCCLRASAVGAPIDRERWWCIAVSNEGMGQTRSRPEFQRSPSVFASEGCPDPGDSQPDWVALASAIAGADDAMADRLHRTEALGNGQVPIQAAAAWRILGGP